MTTIPSKWSFNNISFNIATSFVEMYPLIKYCKYLEKFVYYDNEFKWIEDHDNIYLKKIIEGPFRSRLDYFFETQSLQLKKHTQLIKERQHKVSEFLNNEKKIQLLIRFIARMSSFDGKFNTNNNFILFKNGLYHLKHHRFITEGVPQYWILNNLEMNIDFETIDYDKIKFLQTNLFNKLFPIQKTRQYYFQCLGDLFLDCKKKKNYCEY